MTTGSERSFACWQRWNLMPSNVKLPEHRQLVRAKEKALGNERRQEPFLAKCSDSQEELFCRRTLLFWQGRPQQLKIAKLKQAWSQGRTLTTSPRAAQNTINSRQPTLPWKLDVTSHLFVCWCHILRQSNTSKLGSTKQVLSREFAFAVLLQKHRTNSGPYLWDWAQTWDMHCGKSTTKSTTPSSGHVDQSPATNSDRSAALPLRELAGPAPGWLWFLWQGIYSWQYY